MVSSKESAAPSSNSTQDKNRYDLRGIELRPETFRMDLPDVRLYRDNHGRLGQTLTPPPSSKRTRVNRERLNVEDEGVSSEIVKDYVKGLVYDTSGIVIFWFLYSVKS